MLDFKLSLSRCGLKVTPQRLSILETVHALGDHPTADQIISEVRKRHPNIATGTVYKVLDTLIGHHLIKRVTTDEGVMRYDGLTDHHHHLYCSECKEIRDYHDEDLDRTLREFFRSRTIDGFEIDEFVVQIKGRFHNC
ncbi:MAG: transcriptional repressor [Bacteroidales bacterium]